MTSRFHKLYTGSMAVIVMVVLVYLVRRGFGYYQTNLAERFYHPDHDLLKPSGITGHGLGVFGSLSMLIGVSVYMARKRVRSLSRIGRLKHWLEFHIFLCVLGPLLILFHTSFKFGGLVSISFWSMVAVFLSGIIGRFIYIRIPRSIEGRELGLNEIREMKKDLPSILKDRFDLDQESIETITGSTRIMTNPYQVNPVIQYFRNYREDRRIIRRIKLTMKENRLTRSQRSGVLKLVKNEISLKHRIEGLQTMQNLFRYWHVAHLPFALVMLIIMVIHVAVTVIFGYRWIF